MENYEHTLRKLSEKEEPVNMQGTEPTQKNKQEYLAINN